MRELDRRLRVRRLVILEMVFCKRLPERDFPGRRSSMTEEFSGEHFIPGHEQGEQALEVFQRRVRPPTAARRASSAARSDAMSGAAEGRRRRRLRMRMEVVFFIRYKIGWF